MNAPTVLHCPHNREWALTLDPSQIFPDDPGQGAPLLVEGPDGIYGTYYCAIEMGECGGEIVPESVYAWLDSQEVTDTIVGFWNANT